MNTPFPAVAFCGVITVNVVDMNTPFPAVAFCGVTTVNGVHTNTPSAVACDQSFAVKGCSLVFSDCDHSYELAWLASLLLVYLRLFRMPLDIFQSGNCARI